MEKSYQILFLNARTFSGVLIAPVNDYLLSLYRLFLFMPKAFVKRVNVKLRGAELLPRPL